MFKACKLTCYFRRGQDRGRGISLLIPFRDDDGTRTPAYEWLLKYWAAHLPEAQIVTGTSVSTPFSKTQAFNDARSRATGDIIALIDADCYLDSQVLVQCAKNIRRDRMLGKRLWYIPYRHFYRLNERTTAHILASNPASPVIIPSPPSAADIDNTPEQASHGHWWGAMVQVMPVQAFDLVGGTDPRFTGWGGEDVAFMRALDTLWCKHRTTPNQVLHLWHHAIQAEHKLKVWHGQDSGHSNDALAWRYYAAFGDPRRMRRLVNEYQDGNPPVGEVEARENW
jgi:hypothetical protein